VLVFLGEGTLSKGRQALKIRDYFIRHPDGSWEPKQAVTIKTNAGEVKLSPGISFRPGAQLMGMDIAQLCEQNDDV
jgi:hypothetical protein